VIRAQSAFAGIVGEAAHLGSLVERADGVGAERAEAHGGNVEQRERIGFAAIGPADNDAKIMSVARTRCERVIDPLEIAPVDILLGSKRTFVQLPFSALVHDRTFGAIERRTVGFALEKILADLRTNFLKHETEIGEDRIIALEAVTRTYLKIAPHRGRAISVG
jgi:hypothetical protein